MTPIRLLFGRSHTLGSPWRVTPALCYELAR